MKKRRKQKKPPLYNMACIQKNILEQYGIIYVRCGRTVADDFLKRYIEANPKKVMVCKNFTL